MPSPGGGYRISQGEAPVTAQQVRAMKVRLNDLRSELQDAAERRNAVAGRLRDADPDARAGYQARLQVLDDRILSIENEITGTVAQLRLAPAEAVVAATPQADPEFIVSKVASEIVPIVAILSVFVLGPIALAMARLIWKRATNPPPARGAALDHATQQKLEHLQQAVDTIAIEVERISEGQRFVTKLMSDRALGAGAAEPVRAAARQSVPSERG